MVKDIRVLILDGAVHPEFYNPTDHWSRHLGSVSYSSVRLPLGEPAPTLESFSHVIVTGSEDRITKPRQWHEVEARIVRRAVEMGKVVLGSCFGHQMLARELMQGRHAVSSNTPEMGWFPIERLDIAGSGFQNRSLNTAVMGEEDEEGGFERVGQGFSEGGDVLEGGDALLKGLPDPFYIFCSHFDEVIDVEEPWRVLARSARCGVQVMRLEDKPVWGIQAHPEITPSDARLLLEGMLKTNPTHAGLIEPALGMVVRDDEVIDTLVKNFLKIDPIEI